MFPIITNTAQKSFEKQKVNEKIESKKCGVPEICGYYGRACRQMGKDEGANRVLCIHCTLAQYAVEKNLPLTRVWIVAVVQSFDYDSPAYIFSEYNKAKAYLHKLWQDYYNTEIAENSEKLDEQQCFHEDEYAKVTWIDGDKTEFILTYNTPYDEKFFEGDWERYL